MNAKVLCDRPIIMHWVNNIHTGALATERCTCQQHAVSTRDRSILSKESAHEIMDRVIRPTTQVEIHTVHVTRFGMTLHELERPQVNEDA